MNKFLFKWSQLKATFWFIPVIIIGISILLSMALVTLDGMVDVSKDGITRFFLVKSSDSARSILTTISGAMIGVAGTVFSVTLVALTLASSQFGSRLIRNFMYVRLNQVVLGSYISTYLYCLLILNSIRDSEDFAFIPSISILVAILAAIANIILLIVFIHQIATSIQADHVIADISDFISKRIDKFSDNNQSIKTEIINAEGVLKQFKYRLPIYSPVNGYLQYVDKESLTEFLQEENALLELQFRPGAHLVLGLQLGWLHTETEWDTKKKNKITDHLVIGNSKTAQQDLEYSLHQMVEIAVRALSPGINDPYTAITCIDNLKATMCQIAKIEFPAKYQFDKEDNLRIIMDSLDFKVTLETSFNKIRQYAGGSTSVIIRLMESLTTIYDFTETDEQKTAVKKQAQMILRLAKNTITEENDLADLKNKAHAILG